jgi:hypothetical protein
MVVQVVVLELAVVILLLGLVELVLLIKATQVDRATVPPPMTLMVVVAVVEQVQ